MAKNTFQSCPTPTYVAKETGPRVARRVGLPSLPRRGILTSSPPHVVPTPPSPQGRYLNGPDVHETNAPQAYNIHTLPEFLSFLEWDRDSRAVDLSLLRASAVKAANTDAGTLSPAHGSRDCSSALFSSPGLPRSHTRHFNLPCALPPQTPSSPTASPCPPGCRCKQAFTVNGRQS